MVFAWIQLRVTEHLKTGATGEAELATSMDGFGAVPEVLVGSGVVIAE